MKKYELTEQNEQGLYRIRALIDFADVRAGTIGGWIGSEDNLDQEGDCWVYEKAQAYGKAQVYENAQVYESAWVYGDAWVYGSALVYGNAQVCETEQGQTV